LPELYIHPGQGDLQAFLPESLDHTLVEVPIDRPIVLILGPCPQGQVDLGVTKAVNPDHGRGILQHQGMAVHEVHGHGDGLVHVPRIAGANRYVNPPGGHVAGIGDRAAPHALVGESDVGIVRGDHHGGHYADGIDPAGETIDGDPVILFEGADQCQPYPGKEVAHRVLETEAKHQADDGGHGQQGRASLYAQCPKEDQYQDQIQQYLQYTDQETGQQLRQMHPAHNPLQDDHQDLDDQVANYKDDDGDYQVPPVDVQIGDCIIQVQNISRTVGKSWFFKMVAHLYSDGST